MGAVATGRAVMHTNIWERSPTGLPGQVCVRAPVQVYLIGSTCTLLFLLLRGKLPLAFASSVWPLWLVTEGNLCINAKPVCMEGAVACPRAEAISQALNLLRLA